MRVGARATAAHCAAARKGMVVQAHQSLGELLELQLELAGLLHVAHQQLTPHVPLLHEYCEHSLLRSILGADRIYADRLYAGEDPPVSTVNRCV